MWTLPVSILKFWYLQAPFKLISYFLYINDYFVNLFSLHLIIKTFLRPWKNEYRQGLVGFSIFMGVIFKTLLIIADVIMFCVIVVAEIVAFFIFLLIPFVAFILPFIKL